MALPEIASTYRAAERRRHKLEGDDSPPWYTSMIAVLNLPFGFLSKSQSISHSSTLRPRGVVHNPNTSASLPVSPEHWWCTKKLQQSDEDGAEVNELPQNHRSFSDVLFTPGLAQQARDS